MYKIGLVSVSFRQHSPEKIISAAALSGLSCIEWGSDVHAPCKDSRALAGIAKLQQQSGIKCCSYGSYFRLGSDKPEDIKQYINAAKILGTNIIRIWCGSKSSKDFSENECEQLFEDCKKAAEIAEKNDVILCLECHNNTFTDEPYATLKLMQEINSPSFKMYWQPNQYLTDSQNIEYAKIIAPFTKHIHVFNWKGNDKYPLKDAIPLWQEYLDCFSDDKTLLLEFMPDNNIETLPNEANALYKIIGERL